MIAVHNVSRYIPAFAKVMLNIFGLRMLLKSVMRLLILMATLATFILTLSNFVSEYIAMCLIAGICFILLITKQLDLLGMVFLSKGIVYENLSHKNSAKVFYLLASKLLENQWKAYESLERIAETKQDIKYLIRIIKCEKNKKDPKTALIFANCFSMVGSYSKAVEQYEIAIDVLDEPDIRLRLAELHLKMGNPTRCLSVTEMIEDSCIYDALFWVKARAYRALAKLEQALTYIDRAILLRPSNPDYLYEKSHILQEMGRISEAHKQYDKSIDAHERNSKAYSKKGLLYLKSGMTYEAQKNFEKSVYYDNTNARAYVLAQRIKGRIGEARFIDRNRTNQISIMTNEDLFFAIKRQTIIVKVTVTTNAAFENCSINAIEPFGGGLEVVEREKYIRVLTKNIPYEVEFSVIAKRPSDVNFNKPWILNIILYSDTGWTSKEVYFDIDDTEEGRIFFVLTEDHETGVRKDKLLPGKAPAISVKQARMDLIDKSLFSNKIAEKYGIKWTHMIDVGSALGLLRFAGSESSEWRLLYDDLLSYYQTAFARGHDCQLHIHLVAVPESYFFCYRYLRQSDILTFDQTKKLQYFPSKQINSWANVTPGMGDRDVINSRIGSLAFAKQELENALSNQFAQYKTIFFRAGQWDLGRSLAEIEKSAYALSKTGILADSSVTEGGTYYDKGFSFGKPPGKACYFAFKNDLTSEAKSLQDCGLLEILPIRMPQGRHPVTPQDDAKTVVNAYKMFFDSDRIKPGVHIIMEMEHIVSINKESQNKDVLDHHYAGWANIHRHFERVKRVCKRMEFVGTSEAIYSWLHYYSPELVVRLKKLINVECKSNDSMRMKYAIQFLGDGIITKEGKLYDVVVPLPSINSSKVISAKILSYGKCQCIVEQPENSELKVSLFIKEQNVDMFELDVTIEKSIVQTEVEL